MITFATQKDFDDAVMEVILDKLSLRVITRGYPFVTGVDVAITDKQGGTLFDHSDAVS
jgi:hypothetical protein